MFSVKIWGDRGSMPVPGPDTVIFGGNTACLEIRCGKRLFIVDAGSGIRGLGDWLAKNELKNGPIKADIFLTHTHWDHIMGFPMFTPIYIPGTSLTIRGPVNFEDETLEQIIGNQLSYRYWPVRQDELAATIRYESLKETELDLGDGVTVHTKYLNHPVLCLGYRFEYEGKAIVTAYDHEPFVNLFPTDPSNPDYDEAIAEEGNRAAKEENERIEAFYRGADILVHDTQYTAKEYKANKVGWGHSSFEYAINAANRSGVKKLVLFHHDPNRGDTELQELELFYQGKLRGRTALSVEASREGSVYHA
ncbi:MAG TPA: MBL fold metallo-hydrolase [Spirochaetales bacterium]|nr:MBL fold metallo-hydrolase [Spirochaetales bacterium]